MKLNQLNLYQSQTNESLLIVKYEMMLNKLDLN